MYKIAVMGDRDSIYGFASVGLDIFPVDNLASAGKILRSLAENDYGIIYMTEGLCKHLEKELAVYDQRPMPAIIPIPGVSENTGYGMERVRNSVKKAVGSDILFGE